MKWPEIPVQEEPLKDQLELDESVSVETNEALWEKNT